MKRKILSLCLIGALTCFSMACGKAQEEQPAPAATEETTEAAAEETTEEPTTGIANPWKEVTEEETRAYAPNGFSAPEGAENVKWSLMDPSGNGDPTEVMVQLTFDLDGVSYVARQQATGDTPEDISGAYYEWAVTDEGTLQNWAGGMMTCTTSRYVGDDKYVDLCTWYDIETGFSYSLTAEAKDLDGFDIMAIADQIYDPAKQVGANIPDDDYTDEYSIEAINGFAKDVAPVIDISGCDTFTQIVDKKLENGMGYANVNVGGNDLLLVCSGAFDNLGEGMAAIDSTAFMYTDDAIVEVGQICSGGTAYPITVKDGYLYTGSNHWICKIGMVDDAMVIMEKAAVNYDSEGNGTYSYEASDGQDHSDMDSAEAEELFNKLLDEMMSGEIIDYAVVSK